MNDPVAVKSESRVVVHVPESVNRTPGAYG